MGICTNSNIYLLYIFKKLTLRKELKMTPIRDERTKSFLSGLVGGIFYGTAAIFIRLITLDAASIAVWRLLLGGFIIISISKLPKKNFRSYLTSSLYLSIILLLHFIVFVKAVQDTFVINATVIVNCAPIISLLLSAILRIEKVSPQDLIFVVVGILGVFVMFWGSVRLGYNVLGDLEAFLAALTISAYAILARRLLRQGYDPYKLGGMVYCMAGAWGLAAIGTLGGLSTPSSSTDILFILLLAIIPTAGGHTLFLRALRGLAPHEAQILALLEPVVASVLAAVVLHEYPHTSSIIGGLLVFSSILLLSIRVQSKNAKSRSGEKSTT